MTDDQTDQGQSPKPFQFSVLKLLGFVGVLCVVLALFIPAIRAAQEAGRRQTCVNNLKMIGIGLHNYHDIMGTFRPHTPQIPKETRSTVGESLFNPI